MELEYECVEGEPPAAAAKLRSGMFALFQLSLYYSAPRSPRDNLHVSSCEFVQRCN
jgi:hypothetical protein